MGQCLTAGGPPTELEPGWRWLRTRGYTLETPAGYGLQWIQERAGPQNPVTPGVSRQEMDGRVTWWEAVPPDGITFHDTIYHRGKVQILGKERYRFMGAEKGGCIAEVVTLRKPVSFVARVGSLLSPELSVRSRRKERAMFDAIDRDFLNPQD